MGRLLETVGDGSARLMIETSLGRIQNPAYRFAAKKTLPLKWRGFCFKWMK